MRTREEKEKKVTMTKEQAEAILRSMVPFDIDIEWLDGGISLIDVNDNQAWVTVRDYGTYLGVSADASIPTLHVQDILRLADVASRIVCKEKEVAAKPMVDWRKVSRYYGTAWKYAARDKVGYWHLYEKEPRINDEVEAWVGEEIRFLDEAYFKDSDCDWRDSLVCRDDWIPF